MKKSECLGCSDLVAKCDSDGKATKLECEPAGMTIDKLQGCPLALIKAESNPRRRRRVA